MLLKHIGLAEPKGEIMSSSDLVGQQLSLASANDAIRTQIDGETDLNKIAELKALRDSNLSQIANIAKQIRSEQSEESRQTEKSEEKALQEKAFVNREENSIQTRDEQEINFTDTEEDFSFLEESAYDTHNTQAQEQDSALKFLDDIPYQSYSSNKTEDKEDKETVS